MYFAYGIYNCLTVSTVSAVCGGEVIVLNESGVLWWYVGPVLENTCIISGGKKQAKWKEMSSES